MKLLTCGIFFHSDKIWIFTSGPQGWGRLVVLFVLKICPHCGFGKCGEWNSIVRPQLTTILGVAIIPNCLNPLPCHSLLYMVRVFGRQQKWARTVGFRGYSDVKVTLQCLRELLWIWILSSKQEDIFAKGACLVGENINGTVAREKGMTSALHCSIIQNFPCIRSLWSLAEKHVLYQDY